jgi:type VI protein secretion system component VasK
MSDNVEPTEEGVTVEKALTYLSLRIIMIGVTVVVILVMIGAFALIRKRKQKLLGQEKAES